MDRWGAYAMKLCAKKCQVAVLDRIGLGHENADADADALQLVMVVLLTPVLAHCVRRGRDNHGAPVPTS